MWVPAYDAKGRQTGRTSNVLYSIDLVRGLDVYSVDVPGDGRGSEPPPGPLPVPTAVDRAVGAAVPMGLVGGRARRSPSACGGAGGSTRREITMPRPAGWRT